MNIYFKIQGNPDNVMPFFRSLVFVKEDQENVFVEHLDKVKPIPKNIISRIEK